MNVPMSWLRAMVGGLDGDLRAFCEKVTLVGLKVEGIERLAENISGVVVGKILSIEKHPNADKLLITQIDVGERGVQVVTGATNLSVGDYVPVALDGASLAGGKTIKKGKLRGEVSEGMLCDIGELGYSRHDYPEAPEDGIYIFMNPQPLGADVKPILQLEDEVIDFETFSNRPDCNSMIGVAREAAAMYGKKFVPEAITVNEAGDGNASDLIEVEIHNAGLCPRYVARIVTDIKIEPSPLWLRHRLTASGVRPINNIVDITNYVMLEYGQPMHAFDIENIAGRKIIVRNARAGETFATLDGIERKLDASMLVIADTEKAVAVAGVMGGENSMVTENASAILFESANFNGPNVRITSKKLGLRTDSSARFEKSLDPNLPLDAVNRAMQLIEELGCGRVVPGIVDAYPSPDSVTVRNVQYDPKNINALIGTDIEPDEMIKTLSLIGIETDLRMSATEYEAKIPTFRSDIQREADIAEEIARFYGYNNVPSRHTQFVSSSGARTPIRVFTDKIYAAMRSLGYNEALTYPFEGPDVFDKLLLEPDDERRKAIRIQNPLGEEYSIMRKVSLNGLLESLSVNFNRKNESARLCEAAYVYIPKALPLSELPEEKFVLSVIGYDKNGGDFFDFKGVIEELLSSIGLLNAAAFEAYASGNDGPALPFMHPGRTALVNISGENIGYFGELHPKARENYQIGERVYAAVLDLEKLFSLASDVKINVKPLPKFPAVERDIALQLKSEIPAAAVESAIKEKAGPLLSGLRLFDVYQGIQIEEGFKSMAYSLNFRAQDRTLVDEEVSTIIKKVLDNLASKLGAVLRDK